MSRTIRIASLGALVALALALAPAAQAKDEPCCFCGSYWVCPDPYCEHCGENVAGLEGIVSPEQLLLMDLLQSGAFDREPACATDAGVQLAVEPALEETPDELAATATEPTPKS